MGRECDKLLENLSIEFPPHTKIERDGERERRESAENVAGVLCSIMWPYKRHLCSQLVRFIACLFVFPTFCCLFH